MCYKLLERNSFRSKGIVRLLKDALKSVKKPLFVLWDNASIHKSSVIKSFLETQAKCHKIVLDDYKPDDYKKNSSEIKTARLIKSRKKDVHLGFIPPYSPEMNPVEKLWSYVKTVLLKNRFFKTINELKRGIVEALERVRKDKNLIISFFKHKDCCYMLC